MKTKSPENASCHGDTFSLSPLLKSCKKKKSGGFQTIPIILEGKDVVAMARTGSGKTACFLIPMFEKAQSLSTRIGPKALIISPTRELALQTVKFTRELGCRTSLLAAVLLGGISLEEQFDAIHNNPDIIVATPGRFAHICVEMDLKLDNVEYVVFDEADHLFELGFKEQMLEILARLPERRQTLLFSATLPKVLVQFVRAGLRDPVLIRLDVESKLSTTLNMAFLKCKSEDKVAILSYILRNIIRPHEMTLIFAATKHHVEYLHLVLVRLGIENTYAFSSLDATARKINVAKFCNGQIGCMLVTDIAARGIDIPYLDNVINYNFPEKPKLFVHRVGRVARVGRFGMAYSLIAPDEEAYLLDLHLFLSENIKYAPVENSNTQDTEVDKIYGHVPQNIVDVELDYIQELHTTDSDIEKAHKSAVNAYKQYVKCRQAASAISISRMKEENWDREIGGHPLFLMQNSNKDFANERCSMLRSLHLLRPKHTVFEISKTSNSQVSKNMHLKRVSDDSYINKFHAKKLERQLEKAKQMKSKSRRVNDDVEKPTEEEIEEIFFSSDKSNFKQNEYYIPYLDKNHFSEAGYGVGTSFEKVAANATLDLIQDDEEEIRKKASHKMWDKKKMKFKGPSKSVKKIKTESGVWISSSYKSGRYKKWKLANMVSQTHPDSDEDMKRKPKRTGVLTLNNPYGRRHDPKNAKFGKIKSKQELRTREQVLKFRKVRSRNIGKSRPKKGKKRGKPRS